MDQFPILKTPIYKFDIKNCYCASPTLTGNFPVKEQNPFNNQHRNMTINPVIKKGPHDN